MSGAVYKAAPSPLGARNPPYLDTKALNPGGLGAGPQKLAGDSRLDKRSRYSVSGVRVEVGWINNFSSSKIPNS